MRLGRVGNWNYYWHSMRRFVPQLQEGRHVQAEWGSWDYPYPEYSLHKTKGSQSAAASINLFIHHWEHGDPLCQENYMLTSKLLSVSSSIIGSMRSFVSGKLHAHIEAFVLRRAVSFCPSVLSHCTTPSHQKVDIDNMKLIQSHQTAPSKWCLQYIDLNF